MDGLPIRPRPGASLDEIDASFEGKPAAKVIRPTTNIPPRLLQKPDLPSRPALVESPIEPKFSTSSNLVGVVTERQVANKVPKAPRLDDVLGPASVASPSDQTQNQKPSRFARARAERDKGSQVSQTGGFPASKKITIGSNPSSSQPPRMVPVSSTQVTDSMSELLRSVGDENQRILDAMSPKEIEDERRQVQDLKLSQNVIDMLKKRGTQKVQMTTQITHHPLAENSTTIEGSTPPAALREETVEDEYGTPEHIRRTYFPNESDPSPLGALDWIIGNHQEEITKIEIVFNLQGQACYASISTQESHTGHEHHATNSSNPTFSVTSLLSLLGSEVAAQRSVAFQLAGRIIRRYQAGAYGEMTDEIKQSLTKHNFGLEVIKRASLGLLLKEKNQRLLAAMLEAMESLVGLPNIEKGLLILLYEWGIRHWDRPPSRTIKNKIVDPSPASFLAHSGALKELYECRVEGSVNLLILSILSSLSVRGFSVPSPPRHFLDRITGILTSCNWPSSRVELPSIIPLVYMHILVSSSRTNAERLLSSRACDVMLRFLAIPPWNAVGVEPQASQFTNLILSIYQAWAEYGMGGGELLRAARSLLQVLDTHFAEGPVSDEEQEVGLYESWLAVKLAWTVAAMNPHSLTPPHDIVWTQIEELALSSFDTLEAVTIRRNIQIATPVINLAASAIEGLQITNADNRFASLKHVAELTRSAWRSLNEMVQSAKARINDPNTTSTNRLHACSFLHACLRLRRQLPDIVLFTLDKSIFVSLLQHLAVDGFQAAQMNIIEFCLDGIVDLDLHVKIALSFIMLTFLRSGQELSAVRLFDSTMINLMRESLNLSTLGVDSLEQPSLKHLPLLRPSIAQNFNLDLDDVMTQRQDILKDRITRLSSRDLILSPDWMFAGVDYLLRSRTEEPDVLVAEEREVVQVSLTLARIHLVAFNGHMIVTDCSTLLFNIMKVYILEKNRPLLSVDSTQQLFRDPSISHSIRYLLNSIHQLPGNVIAQGLENASLVFLKETPFYQFYSDLLGVYDSVSFGDQTFARLLVVPLTMRYAPDYRLLFWKDSLHVARHVRLVKEDILCEWDISDFYFPVESNINLILAYVKALGTRVITDTRNPFLYSVALHHIASFIWNSAITESKKNILNSLDSFSADQVLNYVVEPQVMNTFDSSKRVARLSMLPTSISSRLQGSSA